MRQEEIHSNMQFHKNMQAKIKVPNTALGNSALSEKPKRRRIWNKRQNFKTD
jgi:hypothetical protein